METILNTGINFDNWEHVLYDALSDAASAEQEEIVELLLRHGANVNLFDDCIEPPIISAVYTGNFNITKMLLQHGADVECTNIDGFTPLLAAVEMEDAEMIDILLRYGEYPYIPINCYLCYIFYAMSELCFKVRICLENLQVLRFHLCVLLAS